MVENLKRSELAISTILIVVVLVVVIAVGGIAVYYVSSQGASDGSSPPSATSTTGASVVPTATAASGTDSPMPTLSATIASSAAPDVAGASSLKYSVSLTENGVLQGAYTYYGKNAGSNNFMMRIEYTDAEDEEESIYIFNGAKQKAWVYSSGEWADISAFYTTQYGTWENLWHSYVNSLSSWAGLGDYTYSSGGSTVRIYDISVNPALADSLFEH